MANPVCQTARWEPCFPPGSPKKRALIRDSPSRPLLHLICNHFWSILTSFCYHFGRLLRPLWAHSVPRASFFCRLLVYLACAACLCLLLLLSASCCFCVLLVSLACASFFRRLLVYLACAACLSLLLLLSDSCLCFLRVPPAACL